MKKVPEEARPVVVAEQETQGSYVPSYIRALSEGGREKSLQSQIVMSVVSSR